jgi:hypothetical protein
MTTKEVYAIPPDENGHRRLPNGQLVELSAGCQIHDSLWNIGRMGEYVRICPRVTIGAGVSIGPCADIGEGATIGDAVEIAAEGIIGSMTIVSRRARTGVGAVVGRWVKIGEDARLGNRIRMLDGIRVKNGAVIECTPLQIQGPRHVVYPYAPGVIGVGCRIRTLKQWERYGQAIARDSEATDWESYGPYIRMVADWMEKHWPE